MTTTSEAPEPVAGARWSPTVRAAVLLVPLLVLYLLGEISGRLLERYAGYLPRRATSFAAGNTYLRTALVPGVRFESGPFRVSVNSLGFRGPEIAVPKPAGTFRIFASGFDTAGAAGVFSDDERALGVPAVGRWYANLSPQGARRRFPRYNAMVHELASAESLLLAEPALHISGTPECLIDWCHFTAKGEERMADLWFETNGRAGWFRSEPSDSDSGD